MRKRGPCEQFIMKPLLKWPKPMRQNAPKAKNKRCAFHHDHDHAIKDCKDLKLRKKAL
ncbi:hypothetical protein COLO4_30258 [Corchorus olitorius]|uniref:Uncharacterized protein n=1 Tax=Corchorus olitorius TaxID=93759 RepID=A0A1R3H9J3_9ROSI|nr:hypothetical protein COLO4_30258 [Corchorus olitorius]